jgi:pilus assembly protein CpaF
VHQARMRDGTRRITQVTEVVGMEGEVVTLQDLFTFDYRSGMDEHGRYRGTIQPTGLRPGFSERLSEQGVQLDPELFAHQGGAIPMAMRRP